MTDRNHYSETLLRSFIGLVGKKQIFLWVSVRMTFSRYVLKSFSQSTTPELMPRSLLNNTSSSVWLATLPCNQETPSAWHDAQISNALPRRLHPLVSHPACGTRTVSVDCISISFCFPLTQHRAVSVIISVWKHAEYIQPGKSKGNTNNPTNTPATCSTLFGQRKQKPPFKLAVALGLKDTGYYFTPVTTITQIRSSVFRLILQAPRQSLISILLMKIHLFNPSQWGITVVSSPFLSQLRYAVVYYCCRLL